MSDHNPRPGTRPSLGIMGREQMGVVATMVESHGRQLSAHPDVVRQEVLCVHLGRDHLQCAVRQCQDARSKLAIVRLTLIDVLPVRAFM